VAESPWVQHLPHLTARLCWSAGGRKKGADCGHVATPNDCGTTLMYIARLHPH
jgi:hypothetical protein